MCESVCIFMSFTVLQCTSYIAFFLSFKYTVCLSVRFLFVCLWAMLPDSNKMMMMMLGGRGGVQANSPDAILHMHEIDRPYTQLHFRPVRYNCCKRAISHGFLSFLTSVCRFRSIIPPYQPASSADIGVARGCTGCTCTSPGRRKKLGEIYRGKLYVCTPQAESALPEAEQESII